MNTDIKINTSEIWPQERDFIIRPDRLKYARRLKNQDFCVFCKSSEALETDFSLDNLMVYKTKHSQILLNKYPYNTGHVIVAPLKHGGSMFELLEEVYIDLMKTIRFAGEVLIKTYDVKGLNIGVNHGKVAGAGIPEHLHWHVIPRWYGDTNFFPIICETKVFPETLEQTWHKIMTAIKKK